MRKVAAIVLGLILATVGLAALLRLSDNQRKDEQLREAAGQIQLALAYWELDQADKLYSVPTDYFPSNIDILIESGYLQSVPTNPYTGQPMRQLMPGDANSLGDYRYISCNMNIIMKDDSIETEITGY